MGKLNIKYSKIVLIVVFVIVVASFCAALPHQQSKRAALLEKSIDLEEKRVCKNKTPCGWAVYIPISKRIDYFMKNSCDCPTGLTCGRTNDDLSISAFVYRCLNSTQVAANPHDPYAIPPKITS